jgi:hypothetical protein
LSRSSGFSEPTACLLQQRDLSRVIQGVIDDEVECLKAVVIASGDGLQEIVDAFDN